MKTKPSRAARSANIRSLWASSVVTYAGWFCIGALLCWFLNLMGWLSPAAGLLAALLTRGYRAIGVVFFGLLPLTILFLALAVKHGGEMCGLWRLRSDPCPKYGMIVEAAPILGIMGTMISLSCAMRNMDVSNGMQAAIREMSVHVGQALTSSVYGISLALLAFLMQCLWKGQNGEVDVK